MQDQSCVLATSSQIVQSLFSKNKYMPMYSAESRGDLKWVVVVFFCVCVSNICKAGGCGSFDMINHDCDSNDQT